MYNRTGLIMGQSALKTNHDRNLNYLSLGDKVQIGDDVHSHIPACSNCGRIKRFPSGGYAVVKLDSGEIMRVRTEDVTKLTDRKSSDS